MELLVSVRSAAEACAALQGGAGLIDVKEPAHGSPGVGRGRHNRSGRSGRGWTASGQRRPGRNRGRRGAQNRSRSGLCEMGAVPPRRVIRMAAGPAAPRRILAESAPNCRPVAVAYVDWERANAPSPQQVCAFACRQRWAVLLLDTWAKDGTTLLDWLSLTEVERLCQSCRRANIFIALAGSLGPKEVLALRPLRPNWFAVRGAVCRKRCRTGAIDPDAVRRMCDLVAQPITNAIVAN